MIFMDYRHQVFNGLISATLLAVLYWLQTPVFARDISGTTDVNETQRYIVILDDPPLATYDGRFLSTPERDTASTSLTATANTFTGASKLDVKSPVSQQYLRFLDERLQSFQDEVILRLGRELKPAHRYRNAVNGFATVMSRTEAEILRDMPRVKSVLVDEVLRLETDSGPLWIGAHQIHDGSSGFAPTGGQGTVVGVIDSGVNFTHPSFEDPGFPGWDHVNPYGSQLGLCREAGIRCNDKLVGVYDFVTDNPNTTWIEENTRGRDNSGHGSHVASTAAGNPVDETISGITVQLAGVAPNANIVSYRVCFIGDPNDGEDDGCQSSASLAAIDQAIADGVDVINYSIGGGEYSPWLSGTVPHAFLNARTAGIFVATSAGNSGPDPATIGSPSNAPWIVTVGNATHDRVLGSLVENLSGGDTTPPGDLVGQSITQGIGITKIVHARDFGNALCAVGEPELGPACKDNTGASSPWRNTGQVFNGEIVVCDRGIYGRVEKGKNVLLAGAGGYILANTEEQGESLTADQHCLPATHIGDRDGDTLRSWLGGGSGHQGSISGFDLYHVAQAGDAISNSSSRGPNPAPVEGVMKPDLIAPGSSILAAIETSSDFGFKSGTSMASPHVAGAGALLKAVHPDWTPSMLSSALLTTATPELAHDFDGSESTIHEHGSGRPRLDQAVNAGLYLDESRLGFLTADPDSDGDPASLNLPGLVDPGCNHICEFQRTLTDLVGGADWTVSTKAFTAGVAIDVAPDIFTLANGGEQSLNISVDLSQSAVIGSWVYGEVRLSSTGLPDAVLPVAIFFNDGDLPNQWRINSMEISGSKEFILDGLTVMPDATFTSAGLVEPTATVENLPQDPSPDDPYDGSTGVMTVWHDVPADTLWLYTRVPASTSSDVDLYVGRDSNGDGKAQESEELCSSHSPINIESCDLFTPVTGNYWVIVQNWAAGDPADEITLESAVVSKNTDSVLLASGDGIVPAGEAQVVRLSWDNVGAVPGTELIGAVGIGTLRDSPNNMGIIPVKFVKTGIAEPKTLVLIDGVERGLTISGNGNHDHIFVDIPPGTESFTVSASVKDVDTGLNDFLEMELYRVNFDDAFNDAPFVAGPDTSGGSLASASGTVSNGPTLTISGDNVVPGRWFVVLINTGSSHADIEIRADLSSSGTPIPLRSGLWQASSRADINQGFDYTDTAGGYRALLWYTYDESGNPAWYVASDIEPASNVWVAELLRVTNDGSLQQEAPVGHVSITLLAEEDSIFSFVLFGEEGSDREFPSLPPGCPTVNNSEKSYDGIWSRNAVGVGGASVVVKEASQAFVHYLFDDRGRPVWLIGAPDPQSPSVSESTLSQFSGYCAVCSEDELTNEPVGLFTRDFFSEDTMRWNLNYVLLPPLSGSVNRTDDTAKLTARVACE